MDAAVGVVVIGRNEGDRLIKCLDSLLAQVAEGSRIVYVDSGSTDGSCDAARARGIAVVELDLTRPFTAARARNAGWQQLCEAHPEIRYVQFIDGDCQLTEGWLNAALSCLQSKPRVAVVCGRRREEYPDASPYNRLADMEWDTPVGEADACGGDALIRVEALRAVEGYNPALICGEEPEMCIRLRRQGWKVRRIDAEMTLHDAAMYRLEQWWKRSVRGGWAVAEGFAMYGAAPEKYMVRENTSGWLWGAILPAIALGAAWFTRGASVALLLAFYALLGLRIYTYRHRERSERPVHASLYALFCTLSKVPQAIGQGSYWLTRWRGTAATLIEYKSPAVR